MQRLTHNGDRHGFTLVELAIVIVIAGILVAIAIPIYGSLVDASKWSEGESIAGVIRRSTDIYLAKNSGEWGALDGASTVFGLQDSVAYDGQTQSAIRWIGLNEGSIEGSKYFRLADTSIDKSDPSGFAVIVVGDPVTVSGAPAGTLTMTKGGDVDIVKP